MSIALFVVGKPIHTHTHTHIHTHTHTHWNWVQEPNLHWEQFFLVVIKQNGVTDI